jgi:hypothetical protein
VLPLRADAPIRALSFYRARAQHLPGVAMLKRQSKEAARLHRFSTGISIYAMRHPEVNAMLAAANKAAEAAGLPTRTMRAFLKDVWEDLTLSEVHECLNLALANKQRLVELYDQWQGGELAPDTNKEARRIDKAAVSARNFVTPGAKRAAAVEARARLQKALAEEAEDSEVDDEHPDDDSAAAEVDECGAPVSEEGEPEVQGVGKVAPLALALDAHEEEEEEEEESGGGVDVAHAGSEVWVGGTDADAVDADDAISAPPAAAMQLAVVQPETAAEVAVALAPLAPLFASALLISAAELPAAQDDAMAVDAPPLLLLAPSDSGLAHLLQRAAPEVASGSTSAAAVVFDGGAAFEFPELPPPAPTAAEAEAAYAAAGGEAREAELLAAREAARAHPLAGDAAGDAAEEARLAAATTACDAAAKLEARLNAAARDAKAARVAAEVAEQLARDAGAIRKRRRDAEDVYDAFRARHG